MSTAATARAYDRRAPVRKSRVELLTLLLAALVALGGQVFVYGRLTERVDAQGQRLDELKSDLREIRAILLEGRK